MTGHQMAGHRIVFDPRATMPQANAAE